jgi:hypothetical protein
MSGFEDVKRKKKVCVIWEGTGMEENMREKKRQMSYSIDKYMGVVEGRS